MKTKNGETEMIHVKRPRKNAIKTRLPDTGVGVARARIGSTASGNGSGGNAGASGNGSGGNASASGAAGSGSTGVGDRPTLTTDRSSRNDSTLPKPPAVPAVPAQDSKHPNIGSGIRTAKRNAAASADSTHAETKTAKDSSVRVEESAPKKSRFKEYRDKVKKEEDSALIASYIVALVDGLVKANVDESAAMTKEERELIEPPLSRLLTKLSPEMQEAIQTFSDPVILISGLISYGSRVTAIYNEKKKMKANEVRAIETPPAPQTEAKEEKKETPPMTLNISDQIIQAQFARATGIQ